MHTPLSEVLAEKGADYYCVGTNATVAQAVREMNRRSVGSLLVVEQGELMGIFTERDVLVRVVDKELDPALVKVCQCMTKSPLTVAPGTSVEDAMLLITRYRCRHLPVVENGCILGLVSAGDLTRWLVRDRECEIDDLMHYINGIYDPQACRDI